MLFGHKECFSGFPGYREIKRPHRTVHEASQEAFDALAKKDVERMVKAVHRMELASLEVMQGLDRLVENAVIPESAPRHSHRAAPSAQRPTPVKA
jgi:hypothetical protein